MGLVELELFGCLDSRVTMGEDVDLAGGGEEGGRRGWAGGSSWREEGEGRGGVWDSRWEGSWSGGREGAEGERMAERRC